VNRARGPQCETLRGCILRSETKLKIDGRFPLALENTFVNRAAIEVAALACRDDAEALTALARVLWALGDRAQGQEEPQKLDDDKVVACAERELVAAVRAATSDTLARRQGDATGGSSADPRPEVDAALND
jgi:hypothetical protein